MSIIEEIRTAANKWHCDFGGAPSTVYLGLTEKQRLTDFFNSEILMSTTSMPELIGESRELRIAGLTVKTVSDDTYMDFSP